MAQHGRGMDKDTTATRLLPGSDADGRTAAGTLAQNGSHKRRAKRNCARENKTATLQMDGCLAGPTELETLAIEEEKEDDMETQQYQEARGSCGERPARLQDYHHRTGDECGSGERGLNAPTTYGCRCDCGFPARRIIATTETEGWFRCICVECLHGARCVSVLHHVIVIFRGPICVDCLPGNQIPRTPPGGPISKPKRPRSPTPPRKKPRTDTKTTGQHSLTGKSGDEPQRKAARQ